MLRAPFDRWLRTPIGRGVLWLLEALSISFCNFLRSERSVAFSVLSSAFSFSKVAIFVSASVKRSRRTVDNGISFSVGDYTHSVLLWPN